MIEFPPLPTGEEIHRTRALIWDDGKGESLSLRAVRSRLEQEREKAILYMLLNLTAPNASVAPNEVLAGIIRFLLEKYK
jgi:hypothetical protein